MTTQIGCDGNVVGSIPARIRADEAPELFPIK